MNNLSKNKRDLIRNVLIGIVLISFIGISLNNTSNDTESKDKSTYKGPPKFILTEMNGRKLNDLAFFTINLDNTFTLRLIDGTIYTYTPISHFGDEPLCNILANDNFGRKTAICIKVLSGRNIMIMLENEDMISNFKGYKK